MSMTSDSGRFASWEDEAIAVIRGLAMDAPAAARSGHTGTAMALAPLGVALFSRVLRHDPSDPQWRDRDRFILSCGHASILLYSLLHLSGYDLTVEDLRSFRQLESRTPGHPEHGLTAGVEVTTGPLGQGFANSVGMAIAERYLRHRVGSALVDHRTWVFASDGDLMEGVSHEAASLAGHLGLGRLCVVYDDNHITIDGPTELALNDDVFGRFGAYGWDVRPLGESGEDLDALTAALEDAREDTGRPTLLVLRSHIGYPSAKMRDRKEAHGSPFSAEEIAATKAVLGLPPEEAFYVPDGLRERFAASLAPMRAARSQWQSRVDADPQTAALLDRYYAGAAGAPGAGEVVHGEVGEEVATRVAANRLLIEASARIPGLVAGSADLTGNTGAQLPAESAQSRDDPGGRQIHFGIREFAMAASLTGMALHGGVQPLGATFFVFSDYMRPALRVAAISKAPIRLFFSHDSIGVGEDGPTHQPVDQLASLRAMPGIDVVRPADEHECAAVFDTYLAVEGPAALVLSRQELPVLAETAAPAFGDATRGAYVLREDGEAQATLVATGSEVHLCLAAADELAGAGIAVRVVSMPCWEWFDRTEFDYQDAVLREDLPTITVEAGATFGWDRYADVALGIDEFGTSAPATVAFEYFGFTPAAVAACVREVLGE